MIYRSNLTCPDLAPHFKLLTPAIQMMGHDCPSDPDFGPGCGFLTHDEAAILYRIAKAWPYRWVDIGARFGWSTAHIAAAMPMAVTPVDPELAMQGPSARFETNADHCWDEIFEVAAVTSEAYFARPREQPIQGAMIDGNHDAPEPTLDAIRAIKAGAKVLVWHDFQGQPIQDAVMVVTGNDEWKCRVYDTPNGMAVAWLDGCSFVPPDHVPDPAIDWNEVRRTRAGAFDFGRTC